MIEKNSAFSGFRIRSGNPVRCLLVAWLAAAALNPAIAAAGQPATRVARSAMASSTRIIAFNMVKSSGYDIDKNGTVVGSGVVTPAGSISHTENTQTGDRITIILTGVSPVDPSTPAAFDASGGDDGCITVQWATPPATEYVDRYELRWGTSPGQYDYSVNVSLLSVVNQGNTSYYTHCGFPTGTYYMVLGAHNQFERTSPFTPYATASVTNGSTTGPQPPQNVSAALSTPGCATVSWTQSSDPSVTGYRVYYGQSSGAYTDSVETSVTGSVQICGFTDATYYFAMRSVAAGGLISGFSRQVSLTTVGPDVVGPVAQLVFPVEGSTGVPVNTVVTIDVTDDKTGINESAVTISADGVLAGIRFVAIPQGQMLIGTFPTELAPNAAINLQIVVSDNAVPPNQTTESWTFTTGAGRMVDNTAPAVYATTPSDLATDIAATSEIKASIADEGFGTDPESITMYVDGAPVEYTISGTLLDLDIVYAAATEFAPASVVNVRIDACDLADPPNCSSYEFSFTVNEGAFAGLGPGAIVPDGFWVDQPDRPLEVRNLPLEWSIRIFDAIGTQVRRFQNVESEGYNWSWDFTNDHGHRVARALYLVRVIDGSGRVQQRGRFVVQIDP